VAAGGRITSVGLHRKIDNARGNFFWHALNMKRKYHMAKWELMTSPKKAGGRVSLTPE
jgi:hypothetical protein